MRTPFPDDDEGILRRFDRLCQMALKGEAINYYKYMDYRREKEIMLDFYFIVVFFYGGTMMNTYKTAEIAKIIGIHPNTVRLYEKLELIPKPERLANGYRVFTDFHIEQFKIARLAFQIEVMQNGLRKKIVLMIKMAAAKKFDTAISLTQEYLIQLRQEQANAEEAINIVKQFLSETTEENIHFLKRKEVSEYLNISMGALILIGTFFINWKLALAECIVLLIAMPILAWGNYLVEKYGNQKRKLNDKMVSIVLEYISGMKVFKSHNMTSTHFTRMADTLESIRKTNVEAEVKQAVPTSMYSMVTNLLLPFVLLIGSYLFVGGNIAPEQLVAFLLMSLALSALLIAFEHSYNLLKNLKLAAGNLENAYSTRPLSYKEETVELSRFDVKFEHVSFSYNRKTEVLHDIRI